MRTLMLDGLFIYKEPENIFDGKTSLEIIFEKAKKNNFDRYILLNNGKITNIPDGIKNVELNDITPFTILNVILNESRNSDEIAVFDAGNPLYDFEFIEKMLEHHNKYIADYTYSIGYPEGLVPVILRKDVLKEMIKLVEDDEEIKKDYLFFALSKDINSFDIETFLSPFDLRIYRIKLGQNDIGEEIFTKKSFQKFKNDFSTDKLTEYYFKNLHELYSVPYMLNLEITNYSPVSSIYYPEIKNEKKEINLHDAKKIISSMYEINKDFHLLLGGIGEPICHPDFFDIIKFISNKNINCIIETTGTLIDDTFMERIKNLDKKKNIFVIKFDCYDDATYKLIHPNGDFKKTQNAITLLKNAGFKVYKQVVRMFENEIEIEKYIRNKEADDLIIRKYSSYCGTMPDKKVVDLSPLERIPCFHLRREIFINPDETVNYCMYSQNFILGNLKNEGLQNIIEKLDKCYQENAGKNYLPFCKNCDDYYVFNF